MDHSPTREWYFHHSQADIRRMMELNKLDRFTPLAEGFKETAEYYKGGIR